MLLDPRKAFPNSPQRSIRAIILAGIVAATIGLILVGWFLWRKRDTSFPSSQSTPALVPVRLRAQQSEKETSAVAFTKTPLGTQPSSKDHPYCEQKRDLLVELCEQEEITWACMELVWLVGKDSPESQAWMELHQRIVRKHCEESTNVEDLETWCSNVYETSPKGSAERQQIQNRLLLVLQKKCQEAPLDRIRSACWRLQAMAQEGSRERHAVLERLLEFSKQCAEKFSSDCEALYVSAKEGNWPEQTEILKHNHKGALRACQQGNEEGCYAVKKAQEHGSEKGLNLAGPENVLGVYNEACEKGSLEACQHSYSYAPKGSPERKAWLQKLHEVWQKQGLQKCQDGDVASCYDLYKNQNLSDPTSVYGRGRYLELASQKCEAKNDLAACSEVYRAEDFAQVTLSPEEQKLANGLLKRFIELNQAACENEENLKACERLVTEARPQLLEMNYTACEDKGDYQVCPLFVKDRSTSLDRDHFGERSNFLNIKNCINEGKTSCIDGIHQIDQLSTEHQDEIRRQLEEECQKEKTSILCEVLVKAYNQLGKCDSGSP